MVGRSRKRRQRGAVAGNHQRCWIWGRHLVRETLLAGVWPVGELWLASDLPQEEIADVLETAAARHVKVVQADRNALSRQWPREDHQGYLARMPPFPYADREQILTSLKAPALVTVLDRIQDPFNFGAILRSAEVLGVEAAFLGRDAQSEVTSHVARASAGAINRLPIVQDALPELVTALHSRGIQIVGASEKAALTIDDCDFTQPTAIVIGNEGQGMSAAVAAACSALVRIPQTGQLNSLNAAAAAAILFYEAQRQRRGKQVG